MTATGSPAGDAFSGGVSMATAICPADHPKAIGGGLSGTVPGFLLTDGPGNGTSTNFTVGASPPNGWQGALMVNAGTTVTTTVYVICSS